MAVIKAINSKSSVGSVVKYVADKNKTSEELMYGKDCSSNSEKAIEDMTMTKELYNKEDGRQYKHFVQSFNPKDKITPEKAHEIGKEWAEKNFKGYEVFVATHTDKAHMHNHFIVNTVNFETGEKYRQSKADLERYKELSNKLCEREGLTPTEPNKTTLTSFDNKKYKAIEKGMEGDYRSYMLDLWKNVNSSMKKATNKEQFIESMKEKGYGVNWSDTRKHITFETHEGKKVRNSNLAKTFKNDKFTKEGLLDEFNRNGERTRSEGDKSRESTGSIENGDNRKIGRNRNDIENSIIYGRTEKHNIGDNKFIKSLKKYIGEIREKSGAVRGREEATERVLRDGEEETRGNQYKEHTELRQDSTRIEKGNERIKGNEFSENRGDSSSRWTVSDFNREDIHDISRHTERSEEDKRIEDLEGQGITVHNSTRGDSRDNINGDGGLPSGSELLDKIVKQFGELEPSQKEHDVNVEEVDIVEQMLAKDKKALKVYEELKAKGEFKVKELKDIDIDIK